MVVEVRVQEGADGAAGGDALRLGVESDDVPGGAEGRCGGAFDVSGGEDDRGISRGGESAKREGDSQYRGEGAELHG